MINQGMITIRPLHSNDAELLAKWLSDPLVLKYYEGRDNPFNLEKVYEEFFREQDYVKRNIILFEQEQIGYIQFYPLGKEEKMEYGYEEQEVIFGMDQFIGETTYWGKGIGTQFVTMITHYLNQTLGAEKIVMDPQKWNTRAIQCYEKCGFIKKKLLPKQEWHEGEFRDCWLMEFKTIE